MSGSDTRRCSGPTCEGTLLFVLIDSYDRATGEMKPRRRPVDLNPDLVNGNVVVLGNVGRIVDRDEAKRLRDAGNSLHTLHSRTCADTTYFRARFAERSAR
jgi:hypothetical protein